MKRLAGIVVVALVGSACTTQRPERTTSVESQGENAPASAPGITVQVCCDSTKQLDADYMIRITVSDGAHETSITVPVQVQANAAACAAAIEGALDDKGVLASGPTVHDGDYAPRTAWDVTLPQGYVVRSVQVERLGQVASSPFDGQLLIHAH